MGNHFEEQGQLTLPKTQIYDEALIFQTLQYWHGAQQTGQWRSQKQTEMCTRMSRIAEDVLRIRRKMMTR